MYRYKTKKQKIEAIECARLFTECKMLFESIMISEKVDEVNTDFLKLFIFMASAKFFINWYPRHIECWKSGQNTYNFNQTVLKEITGVERSDN